MKLRLLSAILILTCCFVFGVSFTADAGHHHGHRHHHHNHSSSFFSLGFGQTAYAAPVYVQQPVYAASPYYYYQPTYVQPTYVYPASSFSWGFSFGR